MHVTIVLKDINNLLLFERYTYMESIYQILLETYSQIRFRFN